MPFKYINEEGVEVEAFTPEEVQAKEAELAKQIEDLKKVTTEKTENFKKLNEMTEAELAAKSANEIEMLKRIEQTQAELEEEKRKNIEREQGQKIGLKSKLIEDIAGKNEDIKKTIEENYELLSAMPETTPEEIQARFEKASVLAGVQVKRINPNPLFVPISGEAPRYNDDEKEFTDTPKGKEAYEQYLAYKKNSGSNHF